MPRYFSLLISLFILFGLNNCKKNDINCTNGGEVSFHLIKDIQGWRPDCSIDPDSIEIEEEALLKYEQLLSYNQDEYLYELSADAKEKIKENQDQLHTRAFAVMVDDEIVYTCYFWLAYSSSVCAWYTTDPLMIDFRGGLRINMGYPGEVDLEDPDQRNDERILCAFNRDGKLK